MKYLLTLVILSCAISCNALRLQGQEVEKHPETLHNSNPLTSILKSPLNFNLRSKTNGGNQFWTDLRIQDGWRIQQNILTDHYRLLDSKNIRHEWGALIKCEAAFSKISRSWTHPSV